MKRVFGFDDCQITVKFAKSRETIQKKARKAIEEDQQLSGSDDDWDSISNSGDEAVPDNEIMVKHYATLAKILSKYTSGPFPKTLKCLPSNADFTFVLSRLGADQWTSAATKQMTKCFVQSGGEPTAFFYETYLLPRVRDEIAQYKKISFHMAAAMDEAKFRQVEFVNYFLLPWLESDDYTNAELKSLGWYLKKRSFTDDTSKAFVAHLLMSEFSVFRLFICGVMMAKKEVLAETILKLFVDYYMKFDSEEAKMYYTTANVLPVLFYEVLNDFLKTYGNHLTFEDVLNLQKMLRRHPHPYFTKELQNKLSSLQSSVVMGPSTSN